MIARVALASITIAAAAPDTAEQPSSMGLAELQALVDAPDGPPVIELGPGVVHGDLVVRRSVVLHGTSGTVLEGTGSGTTLTIEADDVAVEDLVVRRSGRRHTTEDAGVKAKGTRIRVRGVTIEDALFGVTLQACHDCVVERVHVVGDGDDTELRGDGIKLWESHGTRVSDCTVDRARDVVVWYTRRATLERNVVTRSRYGSHFMYAHDAVVRDSRFERNVVGVFVMYSGRILVENDTFVGARGAAGVGIGFKDSDSVTVKNSSFVANTTGTYLDNTPRTPSEKVVFEGNTFALNDVGMRLHSAEEGLSLVGNAFKDNATLVGVDGGGDALAVEVKGNWFSDYEGYDLDDDGVGDVAYEVKALSSELTEAHETLKLFHGTPAMGVIDAVAHAVPVLASKKLLVDPAPRTRQP